MEEDAGRWQGPGVGQGDEGDQEEMEEEPDPSFLVEIKQGEVDEYEDDYDDEEEEDDDNPTEVMPTHEEVDEYDEQELTQPLLQQPPSATGSGSVTRKRPFPPEPAPVPEVSSLLRTKLMNARPRDTCPICGDRANGIHYGIFTCEGCKNFFKRSVASYAERPYKCKLEQRCNIQVFEDDGVTRRRGTRCQACRYQACVDAGMFYSGQRGGSSAGGAAGGASGKSSKQLPLAQPQGLLLQQQLQQAVPPPLQQQQQPGSSPPKRPTVTFTKVVRPTPRPQLAEDAANAASPPSSRSSSSPPSSAASASSSYNGHTNILALSLQTAKTEQLRHQVRLLQSKLREMQAVVEQKDQQLAIQHDQIEALESQCQLLEQLYGSGGANGNGEQHRSNGESQLQQQLLQPTLPTVPYGNGSVTITSIEPKIKSEVA